VDGTVEAAEVASLTGGVWPDQEVGVRLDSMTFHDRSQGRASRSPGVAKPFFQMMENPTLHAGDPRPADGPARAGRPQDRHDLPAALAAIRASLDELEQQIQVWYG